MTILNIKFLLNNKFCFNDWVDGDVDESFILFYNTLFIIIVTENNMNLFIGFVEIILNKIKNQQLMD